MNETAILNGERYTFVERLRLVDGGSILVCRTASGARAACSEAVWLAHAEVRLHACGAVNQQSATADKIALFRTLFHGREDVFAKRWQNQQTGKSGYAPTCKNEWVQGLCDKRNLPCARCPNRERTPLTDQILYRHLEGKDEAGRDVIGIYPMLSDEQTYLLVADFDDDGWQADISAFAAVCRENGLSPSVERSRSGYGGHVWLFFSEPVCAADARRLGSFLLTCAMKQRAELKMNSYDRLFPNQDTLPKGGLGNLIALPLQGHARKAGNSVFVDDCFAPWKDQWRYLSSVEKISPKRLAELLKTVDQRAELGELCSSEMKDGAPWIHSVPKALSASDFPPETEIILADGIYVKRTGLSSKAQDRIKRLAAFRNPDFFRTQAMRLPTYNKPRVIDISQIVQDYIKLPRGCFQGVTDLIPNYTLQDARYAARSIHVSFHGALRTEQQPAAAAMLAHDIGVLSATTAFGKTVIGAYLIGERKVNTLILVHSTALMTQWKQALAQFLVIEEPLPKQPPQRGRKRNQDVIGLLGGGKNTLSGIVDIAVMQSLFDADEVKPLVREYGMVLCDECHHVPAFTFERILSSVCARYVYGLSATPIRQDGHQPIIFMQCGPIRYRVDAKTQAEKQGFQRFVVTRFTSFRVPNVEELKIQALYSKLAEDDDRNAQMIHDVRAALHAGRTPLVLTERKEHAVKLAEKLDPFCPNVLLLIGGDGQKAKREKLSALKTIPNGEPLAVVATGKYIGEGFDEPRLDTLFLAMPIAWKGTLAQYVGRLHREHQGKTDVQVFDYVDIHVNVLERMAQKRLRGYAELGYQVKADGADPNPGMFFDSQSYYATFVRDVSQAAHEILLVSPLLRKERVMAMLQTLAAPIANGVPVTVITHSPDEVSSEQANDFARLLETIRACGATVIPCGHMHHKFAVIDGSIVWYGSINLLSFGRSDEGILRFESARIAGKLLETTELEVSHEIDC